jgi:hypothetical protein
VKKSSGAVPFDMWPVFSIIIGDILPFGTVFIEQSTSCRQSALIRQQTQGHIRVGIAPLLNQEDSADTADLNREKMVQNTREGEVEHNNSKQLLEISDE